MAGATRVIARSAFVSFRSNTCISTSTISTLRQCVLFRSTPARHRRSLYTTSARRAASNAEMSTIAPQSPTAHPEPPQNTPPVKLSQNDPKWRHPFFGFAAKDIPHLVYLKIPPAATEQDMSVLLSKAKIPNARVIMTYNHYTGCNEGHCFVRMPDTQDVPSAVRALSGLTFFGWSVKAQIYNPGFFLGQHSPNLYHGWQASPSIVLDSRVLQPPKLSPPKVLATMIAERWIQIYNLPPVQHDSPLREGLETEILQKLYARFHQYDVLQITQIKKHPVSSRGWTCNMLFGTREQAKAARALHVSDKFMERTPEGKILRLGPDIKSLLDKFRKSLPVETSKDDVKLLLEEKCIELLNRHRPKLQRPREYPTPESAVGRIAK